MPHSNQVKNESCRMSVHSVISAQPHYQVRVKRNESLIERFDESSWMKKFISICFFKENKINVQEVHQYLDELLGEKLSSTDNANDANKESAVFIPDYNLIVQSEIDILQIHRLVWLAAVRATQCQRSNSEKYQTIEHDLLFVNALNEIVKQNSSTELI